MGIQDWDPGILAPCLGLEGQAAATLWPRNSGRGGQRGPVLQLGEWKKNIDGEGWSVGAKTPPLGQSREKRPLLGAQPTWRL